MSLYLAILAYIMVCGAVWKPSRSDRRKAAYLVTVFGALAFLAACRASTVGVDTPQYYNSYLRIRSMRWSDASSSYYEYGFFALIKLLGLLSPNPQWLLAVSGCFVCLAVAVYLYRNSADAVLGSFLFVGLNLYAMFLNVMRQSIAAGILLFATESLKRKKMRSFVTLVVLASLFHYTALVFLPVPLLARLREGTLRLFTLGACTAAVLFADRFLRFAGLLSPRYAAYTGSAFARPNYFAAVLNALVCLAFYLLGALYRPPQEKGDNRLSYRESAVTISLAMIFLAAAVRATVFERIAVYFTIFYTSWAPGAIRSIKRRNERMIAAILMVLFVFMYCGIVAYFRPEWHGVIPYRFFWQR